MTTAKARVPVIDVDSHWTESPDLWTSRAPASLKDRVPRVVVAEKGRQRWIVEEDHMLAPVGLSVIRKDGKKQYGSWTLKTFEEMSDSSYQPKARLSYLDQQGILAQILYPNTLGLAGSEIMTIKDETLRLFCVTAYNDACAELQAGSGGRLFPQALIPFWDIKLAIKELHRARDMGLTGSVLTDAPEYWNLPALNHEFWYPLWSEMEQLDIPVNFHAGGGVSTEAVTANSPVWPMPMNNGLASMSVMMFVRNMQVMVNLIFSGLLDRFPKLKFVSVESGVGWVPFVIEACEYQFGECLPPEKRNLKLRPRDYFRRNIFYSYWFERRDIERTIEYLGAENVMFETDFPHPTCLFPDVQDQIDISLKNVGESDRRKILFENARNLYRLPIDGLGAE